jgi:hypothetical protein
MPFIEDASIASLRFARAFDEDDAVFLIIASFSELLFALLNEF